MFQSGKVKWHEWLVFADERTEDEVKDEASPTPPAGGVKEPVFIGFSFDF
jgi:hypothetical protein